MAAKSNVLLVGSGGIGTIAALNLEAGGLACVTAVLRSNFDAVTQHGFTIDSCDHGCISGWRPSHIVNHMPAAASASSPPFDYIVIATKVLWDIPPPLTTLIAPAVTPRHTAIVLIQNGLSIEKPFLAAFPHNPILSGVSLCGSHETAPGTIHHDYRDALHVGAFRNANLTPASELASAKEFVRLYGAARKADVQLVTDVPYSRWRKLLYNAVLNPVCALLDMDTTRLRLADDRALVRLLVQPAMAEIRAAALACAGVVLEPELDDLMLESDPLDIFFAPSMLVDVRCGRYTEFEALVGEAVRQGEASGVRMDVCRTLFGLMIGVQWRTKERKGLVQAKLDGCRAAC